MASSFQNTGLVDLESKHSRGQASDVHSYYWRLLYRTRNCGLASNLRIQTSSTPYPRLPPKTRNFDQTVHIRVAAGRSLEPLHRYRLHALPRWQAVSKFEPAPSNDGRGLLCVGNLLQVRNRSVSLSVKLNKPIPITGPWYSSRFQRP
jgi:hypothetical protein